MNGHELAAAGNATCVTGPLRLVDASLVRHLRVLRREVERLEFVATRALLTPAVRLDALRYQLGQLRCVDAVLPKCETFRGERCVELPEPLTFAVTAPVPEVDFQPVTPIVEELAADRPRPLVLVTGCFDLIHAGHMRLIEVAAEMGSRPVVAALTTKGIRAQPKNVTGDRPFWSMLDRLTVLNELKSNPRVTFFDGPDCLELIERLRPEVFVKEQRDRLRDVVQREARLVERLGGRVVWVQDNRFGGSSSTEIAKAIAASQRSLSEVSHGH